MTTLWCWLACKEEALEQQPEPVTAGPLDTIDTGTAPTAPTTQTAQTTQTTAACTAPDPQPPDEIVLPTILQVVPRPDGMNWLASLSTIYESSGYTLDTLIYEANPPKSVMYSDESGALYWTERSSATTLWQLTLGGQATPIGPVDDLSQSIEIHPSGAVLVSTAGGLSWIDPAVGDPVEFPLPISVLGITYDLTYENLWLAHIDGIDTLAVDAEGKPIEGAVPTPVVRNGRSYTDVAVDACGRLYGLWFEWFGFWPGAHHIDRWDESGARFPMPEGTALISGNPLQFGRSPGDETALYAIGTTGLLSYYAPAYVLRWELGVGER